MSVIDFLFILLYYVGLILNYVLKILVDSFSVLVLLRVLWVFCVLKFIRYLSWLRSLLFVIRCFVFEFGFIVFSFFFGVVLFLSVFYYVEKLGYFEFNSINLFNSILVFMWYLVVIMIIIG